MSPVNIHFLKHCNNSLHKNTTNIDTDHFLWKNRFLVIFFPQSSEKIQIYINIKNINIKPHKNMFKVLYSL